MGQRARSDQQHLSVRRQILARHDAVPGSELSAEAMGYQSASLLDSPFQLGAHLGRAHGL